MDLAFRHTSRHKEEENGEEEEDGEMEVQLGFRNYAYKSNWIN